MGQNDKTKSMLNFEKQFSMLLIKLFDVVVSLIRHVLNKDSSM